MGFGFAFGFDSGFGAGASTDVRHEPRRLGRVGVLVHEERLET